jgi:ABC-2 type transport system ATP-binding protein
MTTTPVLEVHELGKRYADDGYELQPTSFSMAIGTTNAVLGANGAGKSTLFQLLSGNSFPTSGHITFMGHKLRPEQVALKHHIGYLPQNLQLPPWITGLELLRYAASLYRIPRAPERVTTMLQRWDCESFAKLPLAACSHGMQKRLALGLALIHDPKMLILDEPFSGLDLFHTKTLEEEISQRQKAGKLTILSTHIIPYVVDLCQRAAVLKDGRLTFISPWHTAKDQEKTQLIEACFFK